MEGVPARVVSTPIPALPKIPKMGEFPSSFSSVPKFSISKRHQSTREVPWLRSREYPEYWSRSQTRARLLAGILDGRRDRGCAGNGLLDEGQGQFPPRWWLEPRSQRPQQRVWSGLRTGMRWNGGRGMNPSPLGTGRGGRVTEPSLRNRRVRAAIPMDYAALGSGIWDPNLRQAPVGPERGEGGGKRRKRRRRKVARDDVEAQAPNGRQLPAVGS